MPENSPNDITFPSNPAIGYNKVSTLDTIKASLLGALLFYVGFFVSLVLIICYRSLDIRLAKIMSRLWDFNESQSTGFLSRAMSFARRKSGNSGVKKRTSESNSHHNLIKRNSKNNFAARKASNGFGTPSPRVRRQVIQIGAMQMKRIRVH